MNTHKPETVFCRKYQCRLPAMATAPFATEKGREIQQTVSQKAWDEWQRHQTMLINENRLNLRDSKTRAWLMEQMELFFDNEDYARPAGYRPEDNT